MPEQPRQTRVEAELLMALGLFRRRMTTDGVTDLSPAFMGFRHERGNGSGTSPERSRMNQAFLRIGVKPNPAELSVAAAIQARDPSGTNLIQILLQ
jgi:hypothetical protein